ncbi:hypothetical protein N6H14_06865 [Paenibacillus sp. CC-CFT747]|nr:hypothetical protein N6H14_06865 [Paenibacillus sp. CC-CFT747]
MEVGLVPLLLKSRGNLFFYPSGSDFRLTGIQTKRGPAFLRVLQEGS